MKSLLCVLCVVIACLCSTPRCEAGPLGRILSAPVRAVRGVAGLRAERRASGNLPRQRAFRVASFRFSGGSCASGSCGQ